MKPKNVPHGTNSKHEIIIPELEEAARNYKPREFWTDEQTAILRTYYGRVPVSALMNYTGKSYRAIVGKVQQMGLTVKSNLEKHRKGPA